MKVLKFGGASVKDAEAVRNVAEILKRFKGDQYVVVVSAMGKMTNALEELLEIFIKRKEEFEPKLKEIKEFHFDILRDLFGPSNTIFHEIENEFYELEFYFEHHAEDDYNFLYDQVVSAGELLSTRIVSAYLNYVGVRNRWVDIRNFIITDNSFRYAKVDWETSAELINKKIKPGLKSIPVVTQGFIGSTGNKVTTTLGREGSDFSAAILSYVLDAEKVILWKDVPGVFSADPKVFKDAIKFEELSYAEAIEMTYYGSKVLHPKTIKPLQNKSIPLEIKSFKEPGLKGTLIHAQAVVSGDIPVIIVKQDQVLIRLSTKDFSFIAEDNISTIFHAVASQGVKVNLMNSSAISFSICVDNDKVKLQNLIPELEQYFNLQLKENLKLLTIRHFKQEVADRILGDKEVLLEHYNGPTVQFVFED